MNTRCPSDNKAVKAEPEDPTGGLAVYDKRSLKRAVRMHEDLREFEAQATDLELVLAIRLVSRRVRQAIGEYLASYEVPNEPPAV